MHLFKYTIKKFAKDITKVARTFQPECKPIYIESESMLNIPKTVEGDTSDIKIHLSGLYRQWKDLPKKERMLNIKHLLEPMFRPSERTVDQRIASLRLRARATEEIHNRLLSPNTNKMKPTLYGVGKMVLELVEDSESSVSLVTEDALEPLNLNADQAFKIAAAALFRETGGEQWKAVGDLWYSTYNDDYDFARMLAAGSDSRLPFSGDLCIAYAPSHAVCLVCNQEDAQLIEQMISLGDEMSGNQRELSRILWTLNSSGEWVSYTNDIDSNIASIVKIQTIIENSDHYSQQKECLDKIHEVELLDVFVANYVGIRNQQGEVTSMCTYTVNLPSFLPKTDLVNVYDHELEDVLCATSWQAFAGIAGSSIKKRDEYVPVRYELTEALSNEQLELFKQQPVFGE